MGQQYRPSESVSGLPSSAAAVAADFLLEWDNVVKRYHGAAANAVNGVSFGVGAGEIVVLVGPNGSGKTTTMEMASSLRKATSGVVRVLGERIRPGGSQRLHLGVQLQEAGLPLRLKVKEAVRATACLYADPGPVDQILGELGLTEYLNAPVDSLSGGWQRRLDVALACIGRPRVLVLDEPTSGIDPVARADMWQFLRARRLEGVGILASTHDLSEAEAYADRLLVMNRGSIVLQGSVTEVLGQAGGDWRLRLIGADETVDRWARQRNLSLLPCGDARVISGSKDSIVALAEEIEAARERGEVGYRDLLRGPMRLEDVFALAVEAAESPAVETVNQVKV